jgi:dTDP-4-amino-4,6-dideoxygalactose transaminase
MRNDSNLAINGGPKTKTTPYGVAKRFGESELQQLREALEQNTLFYGMGTQVKQACEKMKAYTGQPYVVPCSSGSAAVHLGLIACGIGPGDEVIVTPNTDSGSVIGIIEEGAVPVFCDCAENLQPTAASVAARITSHTRAVVVVHLAGYPAPMDEIDALCRARGIGVVEDCAQSWGTRLNGRLVGTWGTAGAYSTNDFKHISTGDGGFVALADETLYRRVSNYSDKHYDRLFTGEQRQAHHGMNYRMSELQGAVALAQLDKVDAITSRHHAIGLQLEEKLKGLRGARMISGLPGSYSSYWWSALLTDPAHLDGTRDELVKALQAEGINLSSYGGYDLIQRALFRDRIVRPWLEEPRNRYPFVQPDGRKYTYDYTQTPNHKRLIETAITISLGVGYTDQDVNETAAGIHKVFNAFYRS